MKPLNIVRTLTGAVFLMMMTASPSVVVLGHPDESSWKGSSWQETVGLTSWIRAISTYLPKRAFEKNSMTN